MSTPAPRAAEDREGVAKLRLPPNLRRQIADFRYHRMANGTDKRMISEAEAIRGLVLLGLKSFRAANPNPDRR